MKKNELTLNTKVVVVALLFVGFLAFVGLGSAEADSKFGFKNHGDWKTKHSAMSGNYTSSFMHMGFDKEMIKEQMEAGMTKEEILAEAGFTEEEINAYKIKFQKMKGDKEFGKKFDGENWKFHKKFKGDWNIQ